MASVGNHLIVNRRAPVRAYQRAGTGKIEEKTRDFANLAEFEAWYRPTFHGPTWVNSQYLFTDVLLDTLRDPPGGLRERRERAAAGEAPIKKSAGRHQKVKAGGKLYNSTWAAFQALGWNDVKECVKFRTELKAKLNLTYRDIEFSIVEE